MKWKDMKSTSNPSVVDVCAQMNFEGKLDVVLDTSDGLAACLPVLSFAVPHASCWKTFTVRSLCDAKTGKLMDVLAVLDAIEDSCRNVIFDELESLNIEFSVDMLYGFDCDSWTMPNLHRLSTHNLIPSGVFTSLTSLHLHFNFIYHPQAFPHLLNHAPSLDTLSLEFVDFLAPLEPCSRVIHWGIRNLQVQVVDTDWEKMESFYETLKFPGLRRIQISLLDFDAKRDSATAFVSNLVPDPQWSRISHLELHLVSKRGGTYYLKLPFDRLADLETLSLHTDHHLMRSNRWPPLSAIQITKSENVSQMWLEDSIKDMRTCGVWARLQIVAISSCRQLDSSSLENIVGDRLVYGPLSEDDLTYLVRKSTSRVPWAGRPLVQIPIEVLEVVLQSAVLSVPPSERYDCASRLAGVSSTFRKLMLSMPTLWTDIHSAAAAKNRFAVYIGIKRSMSLGLHITLEVDNGSQACADLLEIAAPHAQRWHSFRLQASATSIVFETDRVLSALSETVTPLQLPNLKDLCLNYDFARGKTWAEMLAGGTLWRGHLYRSWHVHNLDSLSCTGVIPTPIFFAKSLTKFDFNLTTDLSYQKPRVLVSFLASVPSLEELSLSYMSYTPRPSGVDITASLPNLRKLNIRITNTKWESISQVHSALETPKLREFSLRLQFLNPLNHAQDITTYLQNLLPGANMRRLTSLHLNVFVEEDPAQGFVETVTLPLRESLLPHLNHLTVEINLPLHPSSDYLPPLTEIRIRNSHLVNIDWLSTLYAQMESNHAWDAVEVVEITNCSSLLDAKQDIRMMIPSWKLLL
ncbi:hypothetical protein SCHPADRAFT_910080 [Schizopora paradoxa]|uniref:F-box domain-containing protein n=1 Tax=Schizopora paradoxa TaxID=27342 RepID=A0A0H2R4I1_9AGAM|nr:hypothetical protein SCHPADRAFT_910080 [Schizopora paradoxa]